MVKIFYPTKIASLGFLLIIIIFLIPPKRYNPDTGENERKNNFSFSQILGFVLFLAFAYLILYTINCLNLNHHVLKEKLVPAEGNIFSTNTLCLNRDTLNEQLKKAINPDSKCIHMAWVHSMIILTTSIIIFALGYSAKFVNTKKDKKSLFDKLANQ
jgi:hypothetical protein|tara:strand:+ start:233 stop:703 length:471 start_codon:yes stop_codon:yes gene_type:complete